jgi:hypothetical protein
MSLLAVFSISGYGQAQIQQTCVLDLSVFDPVGVRLSFSITSVRLQGTGPNFKDDPKLLARVQGTNKDQLSLPSDWISWGVVEITLRDPQGHTLKTDVPLYGCRQKVTLRYGINDTNQDIRIATIYGRLVGCRFDSSWWIRAAPMFGLAGVAHDGYIREDGSFDLTANMQGERHIVIVGKGTQPLITTAANVISGGGRTDIGMIDLGKVCVTAR